MLHATIGGRRIEYRLIPGAADRQPLVLLHEGLGCVAMWRDFPEKVARALGRPALVYSRFGYGGSSGICGRRSPRFMHDEALTVLPALLDHLRIRQPLLVGHSDGASIALIHAADAGRPVEGLVLIAPHVIVEPVCIESIARVTATYHAGPLRAQLARYHANVDDAFLGWSDIWLDPAFRDWSLVAECARLEVPTLLVQGSADEYGTLAQLDLIAGNARGPVSRLVLDGAGHAPHRGHEGEVIEAIVRFARPRAR